MSKLKLVLNLGLLIPLALWLPACEHSVSSYQDEFTKLPNPTVSLNQMPGMVKGDSLYHVTFASSAATQLQITKLTLSFSSDGGNTFATVTSLPTDADSYDWTTPDTNNPKAVLELTIEDSAGNTNSVLSNQFELRSRLPYFSQTVTPTLLLTQTSAQTYGGTCEDTYPIQALVNGSVAQQGNCQNGSWSFNLSVNSNAAWPIVFQEKDPVGHINSAQATLVYATLTPVAAFIKGNSTYTLPLGFGPDPGSQLKSINLSFTPDGTNFSPVTSLPPGSTSYVWSTPTLNGPTGFLQFTVVDIYGNTSSLLSNAFGILSGPPSFTQTQSPSMLVTNQSSETYGGACANTYPIQAFLNGKPTAQTTCSGGTWSLSLSVTSDASYAVSFQETDPVGNVNTLNATWVRDTVPPALTFTLASAATTITNFIKFNITMVDTLADVTSLCLKYTSGTATAPQAPMASDSCWVNVNATGANQPSASPALSVSLANYFFRIGFTPAVYQVYLFGQDQAGNINSTPAKVSVTFQVVEPPVVTNVLVTNDDPPSSLTKATEMVFAPGQEAFIRWKASSPQGGAGLASKPISLYSTLDDNTYTPIAQGLANQGSGACAGDLNASLFTGCFVWTAPPNQFFRVRVAVTDNNGTVSYGISNYLNSGALSGLAGNTDPGLGSSASAALFFNGPRGDGNDPDTQSFVVLPNGTIYFRDAIRGILAISPTDGDQKLFIPTTGTQGGDGGPATSATLKMPAKIALDYKNGLLIFDYDRIRRVDLASGIISTVVGGGTSTNDGVVPLSVKFTPQTAIGLSSMQMPFLPLPNGDLLFQSDQYYAQGARIRLYEAATNSVISISPHGNGDAFSPPNPATGSLGEDIVNCSTQVAGKPFNCRLNDFRAAFNPATYTTGNFSFLQVSVGHVEVGDTFDYPANLVASGPNIGTATTPIVPYLGIDTMRYVTGQDGNIYAIHRLDATDNAWEYNAAKNTWTKILGVGTDGSCPDGTAALSCTMDLTDLFVDASSNIYFMDRGRLRTLDANRNVVTLYGQPFFFGDGDLATSARFNVVNSIDMDNSGQIYVLDRAEYRLRKFTPGGLISPLAGNGANGVPNTSALATSQPLELGAAGDSWDYFRVDLATQNIYLNHGNGSSFGQIGVLGSSGVWQNTPIQAPLGYLPDVLGFDGTNLLIWTGAHDTATNLLENELLNLFPATETGSAVLLVGASGDVSSNSQDFCADGASRSSCTVPASTLALVVPAQFDPTYGWLLLRQGDTEIHKIQSPLAPGSNNTMEGLVTLGHAATSFVFQRTTSNTEQVYYCSGGRLFQRGLTATSDTALPWPVASMQCAGRSLALSTSGNTLIFPYIENGLYGVAQYVLP